MAHVVATAAQGAVTSRGLPLLLMVASGFAALGCQVVWTQQSALWLGHESAAVLAVVAAFFGGLSLGAATLGARIERSARPALWYGACEAAVGAWALVLVMAMPWAGSWLAQRIGAEPGPSWHWSIAFLGTFMMLLPATAAMGGTLPAMERVLANFRSRGSPIAFLYAGNTLGAVIGVLAATFWLVPRFGLAATACACAAACLLCALGSLGLPAAPTMRPRAAHGVPRRTGAALAATGFLGIGYEVIVVRVMSQVAENTVYTYAILLAIYLVGTALGAAAYHRWGARVAADVMRDRLLAALAVACLLGIAALAFAPHAKAALLRASGPSIGWALTGEALLSAAAFAVPTMLMGALFSHLATAARGAGVDLGRALALNTLGAAAAPLAFGLLVMGGAGARWAITAVAAGYLLLLTRAAWRSPRAWIAAASVAAAGALGPSLALVDLPEGGRVLRTLEGPLATVSVVEDATGVARLHINNRQQEGSSATLLADARQGLLPILLHPAPTRALFLGLGTGLTAYSAAQDPALAVDAVELLPEVIEASRVFTADFARSPRVIAGDARRFVRATPTRYDVIVSDNFHPARSGSASLYTVEHFEAVRVRLAPGGVFCQWLPLHQLDLATLRSIVRAFTAVYPDARAMLATHSLDTPVLGLVAHGEASGFDARRLARRIQATPGLDPARFGIDGELALLGAFVAGPRSLARFAGAAPPNTDDRPIVAYLAPRITYSPDSSPRERLMALLKEVDIDPAELLEGPADPSRDSRLERYWKARDRFLEAGLAVRPTADPRAMLAQVREPLLAVLRVSPEFRPAYDPLLRLAAALARTDRGAARALLEELRGVAPARLEAADLLREIEGAVR